MSEKNLTSEYLEEDEPEETRLSVVIVLSAAALILSGAIVFVAGILYGIWRLAHA